MNQSQYDILVAKDYETNQSGTSEKKVAWNKVGKAWMSKSGRALSVELFMHPGIKYVIPFTTQEQKENTNE